MLQAFFGLRGSNSDQEVRHHPPKERMKRSAHSGGFGRQPAEPPTKRLAIEAAQPDSLSEATSTTTDKVHHADLLFDRVILNREEHSSDIAMVSCRLTCRLQHKLYLKFLSASMIYYA